MATLQITEQWTIQDIGTVTTSTNKDTPCVTLTTADLEVTMTNDQARHLAHALQAATDPNKPPTSTNKPKHKPRT